MKNYKNKLNKAHNQKKKIKYSKKIQKKYKKNISMTKNKMPN